MDGIFIEVKRENFSEYDGNTQGAHCMLYARLPDSEFQGCPLLAAVLMQMRFDGRLGFPGGLIEAGEEVVHGLIREMEEEMNFDSETHSLSEDHHIVTHWYPSHKILLHFYALEMRKENLLEVERRALNSPDYGEEVMGFFRVPLYTMADGFLGLPTFLSNTFAGNSYQQLRRGLIQTSIMTEEQFSTAEETCKNIALQTLQKML